jgi:NAD(P)H-hydrate repair Nnr-like enzyme with NAD(P)H-hydrate dehydratase domain
VTGAVIFMQANACQEDFVQGAVDDIADWLERFDVIVVGPGLGRDSVVHDTVIKVCAPCIDFLS